MLNRYNSQYYPDLQHAISGLQHETHLRVTTIMVQVQLGLRKRLELATMSTVHKLGQHDAQAVCVLVGCRRHSTRPATPVSVHSKRGRAGFGTCAVHNEASFPQCRAPPGPFCPLWLQSFLN